jgi:hypothetical protein
MKPYPKRRPANPVLKRSAALEAVSSEVEAAASQDSEVVIAGGQSVDEANKEMTDGRSRAASGGWVVCTV